MIFWLYNAVFISALDIDINMIAADSDRLRFFPINFIEIFAVLIFFNCSKAQFLHDTYIDPCLITDHRRDMLWTHCGMVRNDKYCPAFI